MLSSVNRSLGMEGVVQYDFGKTRPDGRLVLLPVLLNARSKLRSNRYLGQGIKSQSGSHVAQTRRKSGMPLYKRLGSIRIGPGLLHSRRTASWSRRAQNDKTGRLWDVKTGATRRTLDVDAVTQSF